jgi:hypothetical protein
MDRFGGANSCARQPGQLINISTINEYFPNENIEVKQNGLE